MGFRYGIHPDHVHVLCEGDADIDGFLALVDEIDEDPAFRTGLPLLIEDRNSNFNLNPSQTRRMARVFDEVRSRFSDRIAVVVVRNVHFGLGRATEILTEPMQFQFRVFRVLRDARYWLGIEEGSGTGTTEDHPTD